MTNVDPAELAKFESIAARWWDKESEFKPLHDINPLRTNFIDEHAQLAGKKVLDVGCGGGILSEAMTHRGANVTAIDMGPANITTAKLHALESGLTIDYQVIPVEQLAEQQPETFDVVTCLEMLEHVPDPVSIVNACHKLCKPGGQVIFSTLNRNAKSFLLGIVGAEYVLNMVPKGTHDYKKFIRPSELANWSRQAGLTIGTMAGMTYNPITKTFKMGRDTDVNYFMQTIKPAE
jgi:2-polyprenyl-6-hydroxyphenyl methylase/3-demethylubiquinone-9 3-methyltransferase